MAWQKPLDIWMLAGVTCLCVTLRLLFIRVGVDFQWLEPLSCSTPHLWCISEEFHGDNLLNVAIPAHLSTVWLRQMFKLSDFIIQLPLLIIDDVINQMPCLSLGKAQLVYLLDKLINSLALLLQWLV